jgi:hypothetical protein
MPVAPRRSFLAGSGLAAFAAAAARAQPVGAPNAGGRPRMLLGVKTTDPMPAEVRRFERWIGRRVDFVTHYTSQGDYESIADADLGRLDEGMPMDRPLEVSIPLCEDKGSLALTARGAGDRAYTSLFRALAAARPSDPEIWIRPGWEFNGDWYPWSAGGKEDDYRAAFRRVAGLGRAVDRRFRFIWGWTYGSHMGDPMRAYPGDDAVDFFGNDVYRHKNYLGCDPAAAWNAQVTRRHGLAHWSDMADRRGKAKTINEFGRQRRHLPRLPPGRQAHRPGGRLPLRRRGALRPSGPTSGSSASAWSPSRSGTSRPGTTASLLASMNERDPPPRAGRKPAAASRSFSAPASGPRRPGSGPRGATGTSRVR